MPDDCFGQSSIAIFVWDLSAVQPFLSGLKRRKLATDRKSGIKVQRDSCHFRRTPSPCSFRLPSPSAVRVFYHRRGRLDLGSHPPNSLRKSPGYPFPRNFAISSFSWFQATIRYASLAQPHHRLRAPSTAGDRRHDAEAGSRSCCASH